jgi:hypothetical protein
MCPGRRLSGTPDGKRSRRAPSRSACAVDAKVHVLGRDQIRWFHDQNDGRRTPELQQRLTPASRQSSRPNRQRGPLPNLPTMARWWSTGAWSSRRTEELRAVDERRPNGIKHGGRYHDERQPATGSPADERYPKKGEFCGFVPVRIRRRRREQRPPLCWIPANQEVPAWPA